MSSFNFSSSLKLTGFDLRRNRQQIVSWSAALFAVMFLYMILFPSMQEMARIKMEALPKELLTLFHMDRMEDITNFIGYFGIIFNLMLIAMSVFAATFAANLIYREEKFKTIEFLYSLEVSRTEIFVSKLLTAFIANLAILASVTVSTIICGFVNGGDTFVLADLTQIIKFSGFCVFIFMAVGLMVAGITTRVGVAGVCSMVVLISYLLGYLSKLLDTKGQFLAYLSPFELFSPSNAVKLENHTLIEFGLYFALTVVFIVAGGIVYKRRDFNI